MAEPGVVFEGVWKKFKRGERHDSLRDLIPATFKRIIGRREVTSDLESKEFWAVRDMSFTVRPGEALGIIGHNGAGKSTVLKLLTRILKPTKGSCEVRGRVGALIEVAAGFHPDLTGRENVFLQGAIMGMGRGEIQRKFDEIVAFAGVNDFIDTPVKRYSSGMNARLGFAIAAHLDPDVLLIDEVLSVGDAAFQERCIGRMKDLIKKGTPVVFISHHLPSVLDLCTRVIVVDHGKVQFDGLPAEGVQQYQRVPWRKQTIDESMSRGGIRISDVELLSGTGTPAAAFDVTGPMRVRIEYTAQHAVDQVSFAVDIHRGDGIYCAGFNTKLDQRPLELSRGTGSIELTIPRLGLLAGYYLVSVGILDDRRGEPLDLRLRAFPFSVLSDRRGVGVAAIDHEWDFAHSDGPAVAVPPERTSERRVITLDPKKSHSDARHSTALVAHSPV